MENVIMKFHHIGYAVKDFTHAIDFWERMGYSVKTQVYDNEQNVEVCLLKHPEQQPQIELLCPHDDKSPINSILKKNGPSPYHICYEIENIEESISALKVQHFMVVIKPKISNAFNNKRVCFLYNREIGLIEIIEK